MSKQRWGIKTGVVGLLAAVVLSSSYTSAIGTLGSIAPDPDSMMSIDRDGKLAAEGVAHMLKWETVAQVRKIRLGLYNEFSTTAGKSVRITTKNNDLTSCRIYDITKSGRNATSSNRGSFDDDNATINVTMSGAGASTLTYKILMKNVCKYSATRQNVAGDASGWKDNVLFATYKLDGLMMDDSQRSLLNLYKLNFEIGYSAVFSGNDYLGGSLTNSVNFSVHAASDWKVGALKADSDKEYGLRSAYFNNGDNPKMGVYFGQQFGFPCNATAGSLTNKDVRLYDPDISVFGETYFQVRKGNEPLAKSEYASWQNARIDGNKLYTLSNLGGNDIDGWFRADTDNGTATLTVKQFQSGTPYSVWVVNKLQSGKAAPNGNVFSINVLNDAIYGEVNCDYMLRPTIGVNPTTYDGYPNVAATSSINRGGTGVLGDVHTWQIYVVRYPGEPSTRAISQSYTDAPACSMIAAGGSGCEIAAPGAYDTVTSLLAQYAKGGPDPPGTRLCFFARVQNPTGASDDDTKWAYSSSMACAISGFRPKLQVWGHDTLAGGSIQTSLLQAKFGSDWKYVGSWDEYGVFSGALNMTMASGAGLNGGNVSGTNTSWNKVTGANYMVPCTGSGGGDGCFGPVAYPVAIVEKAAALAVNTDYNPSGRCDAGDITVDSIPNPNSITGTRVICTTGTVTINKNLQYHTTPLSQGLPQVLIIAKNIQIDPGVTRVDAWLIAGYKDGSDGALYTCTGWKDIATKLTANDCNNKLEINGPVVAPKIYLGRTHGVRDPNPDEPAERIQLRGDTYVWASQGSSGVSAETAALRELPPRY